MCVCYSYIVEPNTSFPTEKKYILCELIQTYGGEEQSKNSICYSGIYDNEIGHIKGFTQHEKILPKSSLLLSSTKSLLYDTSFLKNKTYKK